MKKHYIQHAEITSNWKKLTMWHMEGGYETIGEVGFKDYEFHTQVGATRSSKRWRCVCVCVRECAHTPRGNSAVCLENCKQ